MKKLISLFLTLALLSTLFVVGTTTASAATTVTGETSYETEGYVHVTEVVADGTQKIYYNVNDTTDDASGDKLSQLYTTACWSLLKFNVGDYSAIESMVLKLNAKRTNSYARIWVYSLDKATFDAAIANTENGIKTLSTANGDTLLPIPETGTHIAQTGYKSSADSAYTDFSITLTSTTAKEAALADGYVYLALGAGYTASSGSTTKKTAWIKTPFDETAANRPALTVTGTKAVDVTTSLDDVASVAAKFTYTATVGSTEGSVYMVVGAYGENDALLNVQISEPLALNAVTEEAPLSLDVDTSAYDASYIKAFLWDASTLEPYMTPITKTIAE